MRLSCSTDPLPSSGGPVDLACDQIGEAARWGADVLLAQVDEAISAGVPASLLVPPEVGISLCRDGLVVAAATSTGVIERPATSRSESAADLALRLAAASLGAGVADGATAYVIVVPRGGEPPVAYEATVTREAAARAIDCTGHAWVEIRKGVRWCSECGIVAEDDLVGLVHRAHYSVADEVEP